MSKKIKVEIIESERGWGAKVDEVKEFDTLKEAEAFIKEYNAQNHEPEVPDWYMYARLQHDPRPGNSQGGV
jgi:hypothetical protein